MEFLSSILNFLNGKKTLLGTVLFFLAVQAQSHGLVNTAMLAQLDVMAQNVGTVVAVIGGVHKGVKWVQNR